MLLQRHFHFLKSCNFNNLHFDFAINLSEFCVSGQRWTPEFSRSGCWLGTTFIDGLFLSKQCYVDSHCPKEVMWLGDPSTESKDNKDPCVVPLLLCIQILLLARSSGGNVLHLSGLCWLFLNHVGDSS